MSSYHKLVKALVGATEPKAVEAAFESTAPGLFRHFAADASDSAVNIARQLAAAQDANAVKALLQSKNNRRIGDLIQEIKPKAKAVKGQNLNETRSYTNFDPEAERIRAQATAEGEAWERAQTAARKEAEWALKLREVERMERAEDLTRIAEQQAKLRETAKSIAEGVAGKASTVLKYTAAGIAAPIAYKAVKDRREDTAISKAIRNDDLDSLL